jgi:hypothetical protein
MNIIEDDESSWGWFIWIDEAADNDETLPYQNLGDDMKDIELGIIVPQKNSKEIIGATIEYPVFRYAVLFILLAGSMAYRCGATILQWVIFSLIGL